MVRYLLMEMNNRFDIVTEREIDGDKEREFVSNSIFQFSVAVISDNFLGKWSHFINTSITNKDTSSFPI